MCIPNCWAHRAALTSDFVALSQAPAEAAIPWTQGQCVACCACSLWYQIILYTW